MDGVFYFVLFGAVQMVILGWQEIRDIHCIKCKQYMLKEKKTSSYFKESTFNMYVDS